MDDTNPLRRYLKRTKLTQAAFARCYGFPVSTVNGWFKGTRRPELDEAFRLETVTKGAIRAAAWTTHSRAA